MAHKVSMIVLKVDLECSRCYNKIRKTLSRYRERYQIREEIFNQKENTVTISGPFCPNKLARKLCCKAGNAIKCIEIVEEMPPEKLKSPDPPKTVPKPVKVTVKVPVPVPVPKPKPEPEVMIMGIAEGEPEGPEEPERDQPKRPASEPPQPPDTIVVEIVVDDPQPLKSAPPAPYEEYGVGPEHHEGYGGPPQPWYDGCDRSPLQWYIGDGRPSCDSEEDPNSCITM